MQRGSTGWRKAALLGISLAMLAASGAEAATRSEYCDRLGVQLDGAISTQADQPAVVEAVALRKKAARLCADHKQAQGIRALANGLKLLGATPEDLGE
ncbi:MAG: hypothetical protein AB1440_20590 [Pseudomonadota bacterium]|jgi:hypothetical protein